MRRSARVRRDPAGRSEEEAEEGRRAGGSGRAAAWQRVRGAEGERRARAEASRGATRETRVNDRCERYGCVC